MKKYELILTDSVTVDEHTLYRIRALLDIPGVRKGDLGGYIESEVNLGHTGSAWVYGEAKVLGEAKVSGSAQVFGSAQVSGSAQVLGEARVFGSARVYGSAKVSEEAWVYGEAKVSGSAQVFGSAQVSGSAQVVGEAQVSEEAQVSGSAKVLGEAKVSGSAKVLGEAKVSGSAQVYGEVELFGGVFRKGIAVLTFCSNYEGYAKGLSDVDGVAYVGAGCRWFTLTEARRHWESKAELRPITLDSLLFAEAVARRMGLSFGLISGTGGLWDDD